MTVVEDLKLFLSFFTELKKFKSITSHHKNTFNFNSTLYNCEKYIFVCDKVLKCESF